MEVETCYPPPPKVVQIAVASYDVVLALGSDGKMWSLEEGGWVRLPSPYDEKAAPAIVPPERLLDR